MKGILIKLVAPVAIVAAGVGAFVLLEAGKPEPEKKTEPSRPLSVYVERAEQTDVSLLVSTEGEVRARTEVNLVAQVAGRVIAVSPEFTEGGIVLPGVTLISIEDTDFQLALSQAQAVVAEAEVGVQEALAIADVARKQLRNADKASPLALKKPQVAQARARLEAALASMELARLELVRLDAAIDSQTRTLFGQVEIKSPYEDNVSQNGMPLAVGLYVKAEIAGRRIENATVIPRNALRAGNNVFVVNSEDRLGVRHVGVVHSSSTEAVIGSGIKPFERVIVSSIRNPIPGMRLSALESSLRHSGVTGGGGL